MYIAYCARADKFGSCLLLSVKRDRRRALKLLIIQFKKAGVDIPDLCLTYDRGNVIVDQAVITLICRQGPFVFSIEADIFLEQLVQCPAFRDHHPAQASFVFNLLFPLLCLRFGLVGFPFLLLVSVFIVIRIDDAVFSVPLLYGSHFHFPRLQIILILSFIFFSS